MNYLEQETIERVARGAALLDARYPGWEGYLDLGRLDMLNIDLCVAGQVGNGVRNVTRGCVSGWGYIQSQCFDDEMGHAMAGHGFVYTEDHDTWVALIKERFDTGALSDAS